MVGTRTDARGRPRGRPRTFDRDRALDVAIINYWRDGPDLVPLNEVCRRAGVSKPGLYRAFGSEDRLMDAALTRYRETVLAPVLAVLSGDRPFREALDELIDVATCEGGPDRPPGCLLARMRGARRVLGPVTGEHVDRLVDSVVASYTAWLTRCAERGEVALSVPVEVAAAYLDAELVLANTRMAAGEDAEVVRAHARLALSALTDRTD